jgi:hypothetical protein
MIINKTKSTEWVCENQQISEEIPGRLGFPSPPPAPVRPPTVDLSPAGGFPLPILGIFCVFLRDGEAAATS